MRLYDISEIHYPLLGFVIQAGFAFEEEKCCIHRFL
jgi:hypothetical protein